MCYFYCFYIHRSTLFLYPPFFGEGVRITVSILIRIRMVDFLRVQTLDTGDDNEEGGNERWKGITELACLLSCVFLIFDFSWLIGRMGRSIERNVVYLPT